jgi:hypothetical protein
MKRMIAVVNLKTGAVTSHPSDTRTLDLPLDFDTGTAEATLDARLHALYRSSFGRDVSCVAHPRPLSWRVRGEKCLIADEESAGIGRYTLCEVEPERVFHR